MGNLGISLIEDSEGHGLPDLSDTYIDARKEKKKQKRDRKGHTRDIFRIY